MTRPISGVGIELEGGWDDPPGQTTTEEINCDCSCPHCDNTEEREIVDDEDDGSWHHDSSVETEDGTAGEWVSPILRGPRIGWQIRNFVQTWYPDHVNDTCGLHIHLGVSAALHGAMQDDREFNDDLLDALRRWGQRHRVWSGSPLWSRLENRNQYCRTRFCSAAEGDRYRAVNFCSYSRHRTLEVRVLPMFKDRKLSIAALRFVVAFVTRWARNNADRIEREAVETLESLPFDTTPIEETFSLSVPTETLLESA